MQAANQAAQQFMGSYIIMPQAAAMGHMPGITNQSMVNQALQMQQQIMMPQIAGYGMQYPFLQRKFFFLFYLSVTYIVNVFCNRV
jgi:hypothetical protein